MCFLLVVDLCAGVVLLVGLSASCGLCYVVGSCGFAGFGLGVYVLPFRFVGVWGWGFASVARVCGFVRLMIFLGDLAFCGLWIMVFLAVADGFGFGSCGLGCYCVGVDCWFVDGLVSCEFGFLGWFVCFWVFGVGAVVGDTGVYDLGFTGVFLGVWVGVVDFGVWGWCGSFGGALNGLRSWVWWF